MLTVAVPAAAFGTNCYVLATGAGQECLVVDPGVGVEDRLAEVLRERRLRPAAVLLTHGHLDHTYSVTPVCRAQGVAAYIHDADEYRLHDPVGALPVELLAMLEHEFGSQAGWPEPEDVRRLADGDTLELAGLRTQVRHAPGHTEGSVMFQLPGIPDAMPDDGSLTSTMLSGDVLFAGSIGRTDLAGGDDAAMQRTLREVVLPLDDPTLVLPGHGRATTIGHERAANPYLRQHLTSPDQGAS